MTTKPIITKIFVIMASLLCSSLAYADIAASHRLINTKAVADGTEITFHLHLTNESLYNFQDVTITPIDPALLLSPYEISVSVYSLEPDQRTVIPWKVTVPYSADKFNNEVPIAFQGSAIDNLGNSHTIFFFSMQEAN